MLPISPGVLIECTLACDDQVTRCDGTICKHFLLDILHFFNKSSRPPSTPFSHRPAARCIKLWQVNSGSQRAKMPRSYERSTGLALA